MTNPSQRHEEKARSVAEDFMGHDRLPKGLVEKIAAALASAEAELVKRMMEKAVHDSEYHVEHFIEEFCAENNISVSDSDIDAAPPRAGSAIAPTRDEGG